MDMRDRYRSVSKFRVYGTMYQVQRRPWWWPFWLYVTVELTEENARAAAVRHGDRHKFKSRTTDYGRLPVGRNSL